MLMILRAPSGCPCITSFLLTHITGFAKHNPYADQYLFRRVRPLVKSFVCRPIDPSFIVVDCLARLEHRGMLPPRPFNDILLLNFPACSVPAAASSTTRQSLDAVDSPSTEACIIAVCLATRSVILLGTERGRPRLTGNTPIRLVTTYVLMVMVAGSRGKGGR